jgi:NADH dehydrogenase FAD-containing subunit
MGATIPRAVVVGGGFGGLSAAKTLKHTPAHGTVIDRTNQTGISGSVRTRACCGSTSGVFRHPTRRSIGETADLTKP